MKAVLVIDMPCEHLLKTFNDLYDRLKGYKCVVRPLPEKWVYEPEDDHPYSKAEIMAYTYGLTIGRNRVIEEITGETE